MLARRLPWFLVAMFAPATVLAQGPAPASAPAGPDMADDEPPSPLVPRATDTLGGHFVAGVGAAIQAPFGQLRQSENATKLGAGLGGAVDLGFGVSRSVVLGAWGNLFEFGTRKTSFAVGPFVRYHVVQGLRFDPWVLFGPGYRSQTRDTPLVKRRFAGFEFVRVGVGGDYYPWSGVGFGPWLELDAGVFGTRPKTNTAGQPDRNDAGNPVTVSPALHFGFVAGLRVVLDLPGK
jgi:hypothetical protein